MGIAVREGDDGPGDRSGYHPMRLATELFPALVAVIGPNEFSPFWAVLFYFSLVAFGIAQQVGALTGGNENDVHSHLFVSYSWLFGIASLTASWPSVLAASNHGRRPSPSALASSDSSCVCRWLPR